MASVVERRISFDFTDGDAGRDAYRNAIRSLRIDLRDPNDQGSVPGQKYIPTLRPQVSIKSEENKRLLSFFDLVLSYNDEGPHYSVKVRYRADNLYLTGWLQDGSDTWTELRHDENTVPRAVGDNTIIRVPGKRSISLDLGDDYTTLQKEAGMGLDTIPVSRASIGGAIKTLATSPPTVVGTQKRSIANAVLILTFATSEAIRFLSISSFIYDRWEHQENVRPELASQMTEWSKISGAIRATQRLHVWHYEPGITGLKSYDDACNALGIMLA